MESCVCNDSLLTASFDQCEKCVDSIILKCKSDKNFKIKMEAEKTYMRNFNALHNAALKGNPVILEKILKSNINININNLNYMGNTPLTCAAVSGNIQCIKLLIEAGCYVNHINYYGVSILHGAFLSDNTEAMAYLMDMGANRIINVENGYFATDCSNYPNHEKNKKFIMEYVTPGEFTKPCRVKEENALS